MNEAALVVAFAMPQFLDALLAGANQFVDALVAGAVEFAREQLRSLDVGSVGDVLKHAMVRKFALGGGGAVGVIMLGHYLRKAEAVIRLLSSAGVFLMLFGLLSLLGVIDLNPSRIAQALGGVL